MVNFSDWIENELAKRNWTRAELARRAGVHQSTLSMIYSGQRSAGTEVCSAIAKALKVPEEEVLRAAGLLSPGIPHDERVERLLNRIALLSETDQRVVDILIEGLLNQQQREENNASSSSPLAAPKQP